MTEHSRAQSELFQSAIERLIPHRYPVLLVDRVTEFIPGERITVSSRPSGSAGPRVPRKRAVGGLQALLGELLGELAGSRQSRAILGSQASPGSAERSPTLLLPGEPAASGKHEEAQGRNKP